jgi:CRISPR-associated protein Csa1
VRAYEARRIVERVQDMLARQPHAGPDALVALALPVSLEVKLNGTYLGLSAHLSADGVLANEAMVADLKFGPREEFHRLTTTGYALVWESLYGVPVEVGCIVYVNVRRGRVVIERDYHVIGDELRHWFVEERDEKMRLVSEELDPGLPATCPATCPYLRVCRPQETSAPAASVEPVSANLPAADTPVPVGAG